MFAVIRPELSIRTGPFAAWLDDPSSAQLDAAYAVARAAVRAGQLALTGNRDLACEADLLGHAYQLLRNTKAQKAHGEMYTPAEMAAIKTRLTLAGAKPGQSICDPYAGTGGLLRAAAQDMRARGIDPRSMRWYAADIDPVVVAGLAVNMHLWDLGPRVVVGCADVLTEDNWETRAIAEQDAAAGQHRLRVLAARALAFDRLMTTALQTGGHAGQDPADGATGSDSGSRPPLAAPP